MKTFHLILALLIICCCVITTASYASPETPWVKVAQTGPEGSAQLLTDYNGDGVYERFFIQGVGYEPLPIGRSGPQWGDINIYDDETILRRDFQLLSNMHANTIRIWKADNTNNSLNEFPNFITTRTLDVAEEYGIKVIPGFWIGFGGYWQCGSNGREFVWDDGFFDLENNRIQPGVREDILNRWRAFIAQFRSHPAVLFWAIGNENNVQLGNDRPELVDAFYALINEMADEAHTLDPDHPVAFVNGDIEVPVLINDQEVNKFPEIITAIAPNVDIWGINLYAGDTFGDIFENFHNELTDGSVALWISEFGIDAWHSDISDDDGGYEDQISQAEWDGNLWDEIVEANDFGIIGATVMEYSDEWWKPNQWMCQVPGWTQWWRPWWEFVDDSGTYLCGVFNDTHDLYGIPPSDGDCDGVKDWFPPSPDDFFNEEWWGIVKPQRNLTLGEPDVMIPRAVYATLQLKFLLGLNPSGLVITPDTGSSGDSVVIQGKSFGEFLADDNYNPKTDLNRDGKVDGEDFAIFCASYNKSSDQTGFNADADFNNDTIVDLQDFFIFVQSYNCSANGTYVQFSPNTSAFARIISWTDTEIVCEVPFGAETGDVVVHALDGAGGPEVFTVSGAPVIDSMSEVQGHVGDSVRIYGSGFGDQQDGSRIEFSGGVTANIITWSDTEIVCQVPDAESGNVYLVADAQRILAGPFEILYNVTITGISQSSVMKGDQLEIYGIGFKSYIVNRQYNPAADFNRDARVDSSDWALFSAAYNSAVGENAYFAAADLNHDGVVNISDFFIFVPGYNSSRGSNYVLFHNQVEARVISWSDTKIVCEVPYFSQSGDIVVMVEGVSSNPHYVDIPE